MGADRRTLADGRKTLRRRPVLFAGAVVAMAGPLAACAEEATIAEAAGYGPTPRLPVPNPTMLPTVNIAPAIGWPVGTAPQPAAALQVTAYASGLDHPRWLHVLPNGDVLVAETNRHPRETGGIRQWVMGKVMARAGAGTPSANRVTLLRGLREDGSADQRFVFLEGLHSPFGMALVGDSLFIANTDAVVRFPYEEGATRINAPGTTLAPLPAGPRNHHWTKSLLASADGQHLYVGVGSNSNVAEFGIEEEVDRAAILQIETATGRSRVFASGLRNPVGMDWEPTTGMLWVAVNERDEIGSDLVPDYMTSVRAGGFYGWPYSYFGQHVDERPRPPRPDLVQRAIVPDYALGAHTASLGLAFGGGGESAFRAGAYVGQHGSWNRRPHSGYKLIFVPFADGRPAGPPQDILTGFLDGDGKARGRPVGVAFDRQGGLLLADDVGNVIWRVSGNAGVAASL